MTVIFCCLSRNESKHLTQREITNLAHLSGCSVVDRNLCSLFFKIVSGKLWDVFPFEISSDKIIYDILYFSLKIHKLIDSAPLHPFSKLFDRAENSYTDMSV